MRPTRRAFLGGLLGGSLATSSPLLAAAPPRRLRRAMAVVGRAYLARFPHESSPALLKRSLGGGRTMGPADALAAAAARRSGDFARGDTVMVGGWLMARSEARACALAALTGGHAHAA